MEEKVNRLDAKLEFKIDEVQQQVTLGQQELLHKQQEMKTDKLQASQRQESMLLQVLD